ncbi:hypothetical protein FGG79_03375 [Bacillus sp. BHET2]|uniref:hypothetical protein n=1 Tax=Bacillus sp. BHET2 TaxID=2583818 RepID=UPI00110E8156|nr:hypothetical protein [Bacillus sp. BHET2]TMU87189.1 hypothetical protein FGG79_03375 [Bacillus sp. BHET2]
MFYHRVSGHRMVCAPAPRYYIHARQYEGGYENQLEMLEKQYSMLDRKMQRLLQRVERIEKQLGIYS